MLERGLNQINRLALKHVGRRWMDYIVSNTMTDLNRRVNGFLWTYELKALVVDIRTEADGVKTFTLLPNQHWKHMQAGQHVEVSAQINGETVSRFYSLSPMNRGCFTITVKRKEGGLLSNWLHDHVRPGATLTLHHPEGQFTYRQQPKVLFVCAGSGITPCYSMVSDLLQGKSAPDMALYAQFARKADTIFAKDLAEWKTRFDVRVAYSHEAHEPGQLLHTRSLLEQYPDLLERDVYLCGPQGFMDQVIAMMTQAGYDLSRLHCERFVAQSFEQAPDETFDPVGAEVYFQHIDAHVRLDEADRGRTLMEIADSRKLNLEVGCRQGMCGTCKLTLKSGQASGNVLGHAVYLCTAYPASRKIVLDT